MSHPTVLVVDDERNMRTTVESILQSDGYRVLLARSGREALVELNRHNVHAIVSDARMSGMDGFKLLSESRQRFPYIPFIMITAYATPKLAVQAIKAGAADYISKPFDPDELLHIVRRVVRGEFLQEENLQLMQLVGRRFHVDDLIGESPTMQEIRRLVRVTAPTDASVLLVGESGTGKEMAASALHLHSGRADKPYVSVNCAAIPENLLESELFGHERGAFTGAIRQRIGRFEEAGGGTLFLDEIGEMSPQLQTKLLRVLEERRFQRVGGSEHVLADVRVIAATNQNIREAVAAGRLRQDLYHRLNVVQIEFPPLRERREDIPMLALHFLRQFNDTMGKRIVGFADATLELMRNYHWPGNVRELRNAIERAVIMESGDHIQPASLPTAVGQPPGPDDAAEPANLEEALALYERRFIERALRKHRGKINDTAAALGITRHALRYRMQKLGMDLDHLFA